MHTVSFTTPRGATPYMIAIMDRFDALLKRMRLPARDRTSTLMDLSACHANGCPLDFKRLADFPDFDLLHDVCGISAHIDRRTGKLEDCFIPRSAKGGIKA